MKYRLNRKNASGTYDTIHYETSSNIVLRPSGRTVEQDLEAYLPRTQSTDDVPQSLEHGEIVVTNDRVYIGDVNGKAMEVVTLAHELNIGTINGMSVEEILDMMVDKGIGISEASKIVFPIPPSVGTILEIGDYKYTIADNRDVIYAVLTYHQENTQFGSSTNYVGSTIANKCTTWYNNNVPQDLKDKGIFVNVSTEGVTSPCFIPTKSQVETEWEYFQTQSNRIFRNTGGTAQYWWTSTANSSSDVWLVGTDGSFGNDRPSSTFGFRPCLALARSAFSTSI